MLQTKSCAAPRLTHRSGVLFGCLVVATIALGMALSSKFDASPPARKTIGSGTARRATEVSDNSRSQYALRTFRAIPLAFEADQARDGQSRYLARGSGYVLSLASREADLLLFHPLDRGHGSARSRKSYSETRLATGHWGLSELRMKLLGANPAPIVQGDSKLPGRVNYFVGNDPSRWKTGLSAYSKVRERDVYPAVDLVFHGHQGQLEYDFTVHPGGQPDRIAFGLEGARRITMDATGNLRARLQGGTVVLRKPRAFQDFGRINQEVAARFRIEGGGKVGFDLGPYDRSRAVVIDPVLSYSTYLGGSGADQARALAVDSSGNIYVTGTTPSTNFPTTTSALQTSLKGGMDIFVTKLIPTSSTLLYSTYLGGSSDDISSHIAVDSSGNAYVTGATSSLDFPVTTGSFQTSLKGPDNAFVTKLNPTGSALVYSTYLGGSSVDFANSIALDASGDAYVTGETFSSDFPSTSGALQTTYRGNGDAFVAELNNTGTALVYSTFLGGTAADEGVGIAVDSSGAAYVDGFTSSSNFPTASPLQAAQAGGKDVFVSKVAPGGASLVYSTFLGGSGDDTAADIAVDGSGNAYVTGQTNSSNFPVASAYQSALGAAGATNGFIAEINATGAALTYSTYLGGSGTDSPQAIAVGSSGDAYITGQTFSSNFPTASAIQSMRLGNSDAFVSELKAGGSALTFSTYLGGSGNDGGAGIAIDSSGNIYIAGFTESSDFPTLAGAYQPASGGSTDAFIVLISPASASAVSLSKTSLTFGNQSLTTTSAPQVVVLRDLGSADLAISSIAITGDFAETNTCFTSVPAASGCTLDVTFSPTATGSRTGTITITDNAAGSPQTISLSGTGINTGVNLAPQSLTFTAQNIGTTSAPQTVTLSNTGTDTLTISSIFAIGDFSESNNCGSSLAGNASCTITVNFTPTQANARTGSLEVVDNAPGSPQSVKLTGTGAGPAVTLSPATLTFSEQPVGTTSGSQTITLTNSGTAPLTGNGSAVLTIASITVSGAFTETNNCAGTLDIGNSCTFSVTFKPTLAGANFGAVTISDNAPGTPQTVQLTGNAISGNAPEVYLSSSTLSFGLEPVTTSSTAQSLTLTNTGNASLSITSIAVTGDYSQTNTCGTSVAAGANCSISVVFAPKTAGPGNASLTITDGASGSPHTVALIGGGDDFAFSSSASTKTINAGQTATYPLNVNPIFGFDQKVSLTCSGAPQAANCTVAPASVTLDGMNPASVTVTVTTTARSMLGPLRETPPASSPLLPYGGSVQWLLALLLLGVLMAAVGRRLPARRAWLALAFLLPLLLWSSCNVGSKINGTPQGAYSLTITGTTTVNGATLTHSGTFGLTVN